MCRLCFDSYWVCNHSETWWNLLKTYQETYQGLSRLAHSESLLPAMRESLLPWNSSNSSRRLPTLIFQGTRQRNRGSAIRSETTSSCRMRTNPRKEDGIRWVCLRIRYRIPSLGEFAHSIHPMCVLIKVPKSSGFGRLVVLPSTFHWDSAGIVSGYFKRIHYLLELLVIAQGFRRNQDQPIFAWASNQIGRSFGKLTCRYWSIN